MSSQSKQPAGPSLQPPAEVLSSRPINDEEKYYLEQAQKEPVERLARLEDVAKFLIGATATISGLFLAAYKLATGKESPSGGAFTLIVPFVLWSLSIAALLLVLLPLRYPAGKNEPASWKVAYQRAGTRKYRWLWVGALLFVAGLLTAAALLEFQHPARL